MKLSGILRFVVVAVTLLTALDMSAGTSRDERRLITEGNKLYVDRKFQDAAKKYEEALKINGASAVAAYNLGLAQIRQVSNPNDTTPKTKALLDNARKNLSAVAALAKDKPGLASKANYNLGNLEFNTDNIKESIEYYKQALRIDPKDNAARKNLRIAQLKQQNQNKDQNKDQQNKDQNQDQSKDKQDRNKDKQDQQNKQDQQQQQNQDKNISQQTANQILQAIDNKENQTRARVNRANKGEKVKGGGARTKRW